MEPLDQNADEIDKAIFDLQDVKNTYLKEKSEFETK